MSDIEEEFVPDSAEASSGEPDGEFDGEENVAVQIKKLRERLKKAVEEKQEYLEGWQRARADFANFKKEEASMHGDKEERVKAEFVEFLLPALDSFEMALKHNPADELKIVHKQLLDSLKKTGVEPFGAPGDVFDPRRYEAIAQVDAKTPEEDHVVDSIERSGYAIYSTGQGGGEKIIRPAHVTIKNYHG